MDTPHFSEAEAHFQTHQQKQMGAEQWLLRLYERLVVLCKSAHYIILQAPEAHLKVKHCLHEALKITEEIQKNEQSNLQKVQFFGQQLQYLFLNNTYRREELAELLQQAQHMELAYREVHPFLKRGKHQTPPLNIRRKTED